MSAMLINTNEKIRELDQLYYNYLLHLNSRYVIAYINRGDSRRRQYRGHYSTVVWADTYKVGCGQAIFLCDQECGGHAGYCFKFVCNYGPG
jgi:hypothetical protein